MILNDPRFVRNSLFNILGQVLPLLIGLATIPTLIHQLGMDRFGLLSLIWVFLGYMTFLDLGLSRAVIKMVSEDLAVDRKDDIAPILWTANWVVLILSLAGSLVIYLVSEWLIERVLHIPPDLHNEAVGALHWIAWTLPLLTLTSVFRGVLEAQHRFLSANVLQAFASSVNYIVPFALLPFSHSIEDLILAVSAGRLVSFLAHAWEAERSIPGLAIPRAPTRAALRRLIDFGSWLTISNLISPLMVYFDRFVLGSYLPVGTLAYYTTPYEIVSRVTILPAAISRVLFPTFSAATAKDAQSSSQLLVKSLDILGFLFLPICALLVIFAPWGLQVWLGPEFAARSAPILQIFALGIFFNGLATLPYTYLQGANRPDLTAKAHLVELPIYALVLWFLTVRFGILGAAAAWTLRMIFDFVLLSFFALRVSKNPMRTVRHLVPLCLLSIVLFVLAYQQIPLGLSLFTLGAALVYLWATLLTTEDRLKILGRTLVEPGALRRPMGRIYAVIVTYNPGPEIESNYRSISAQFDETLLIDNASKGPALERLRKLQAEGARVIFNDENLGIARALNQGFEIAEKEGAEWVGSFDQDSVPPLSFREKMAASLYEGASPSNVALIGPALREMALNRRISRSRLQDSTLVDVPTVITSGSLTRVSAFKAVGGFDDSLFIDYVDHDFALKLRRHGFRVAELPQMTLEHHLGRSRYHALFFTAFVSTHHDPSRRYYNTRNRFLVYCRYFWVEPGWVGSDLYIFCKEILKIILVEKDKREKMRSILSGLLDFFRGAKGPRRNQ